MNPFVFMLMPMYYAYGFSCYPDGESRIRLSITFLNDIKIPARSIKRNVSIFIWELYRNMISLYYLEAFCWLILVREIKGPFIQK